MGHRKLQTPGRVSRHLGPGNQGAAEEAGSPGGRRPPQTLPGTSTLLGGEKADISQFIKSLNSTLVN